MLTIKSGWFKSAPMLAAAIMATAAERAPDFSGDPVPGCAMPPVERNPFGPGAGSIHMPRFLHGIELTEVQQDKVFDFMHELEPRQRESAKAASKAMDELRRLASADSFDKTKARVFAEAHAKAITDTLQLQAEFETRLRAILTPEQRAQISQAQAMQRSGLDSKSPY